MRKVLTITAKITANVLVILFGILVLANVIMKANAPQISSFLGATTQRIEYSEEDEKNSKIIILRSNIFLPTIKA